MKKSIVGEWFYGSLLGFSLAFLAMGNAQGAPGDKLWEFQADSAVNCAPAIGEDGTVYIGTTNGGVYAITPDKGLEKWRNVADGRIAAPVLGTDGSLYVSTSAGTLFAFDATSGQKLWSQALGSDLTVPALGPDGSLYCGSSAGYLFSINSASGATNWVYSMGYPARNSPTVGNDGAVYIGAAGWMHAVNQATGSNRWVFSLTNTPAIFVTPYTNESRSINPAYGEFSTPIILSDGTICALFGVDSSYLPPSIDWHALIGIDPANGSNTWSITYSYSDSPLLEVFRTWNVSPVVDSAGLVLAGASAGGTMRNVWGEFASFDVSKLKIQWQNNLSIGTYFSGEVPPCFGVSKSSSVGSDGTVYFCSAPVSAWEKGGVLNAVNTATGEKLWTFYLGGWPYSTPAIGANGVIYVGSDSGKFYAIQGNSNQGLANSAWPKAYGNARNTGSASSNGTGPVLISTLNTNIDELVPWTMPISVTPVTGATNPLSYYLVSGPEGMALDRDTGVLSWTPSEAQGPSTNVVTVAVVDETWPVPGTTNSFTVVVNEVNQAPQLTPINTQRIDPLVTFELQLEAADADIPTNRLAYSLVSGPEGMTLDSQTGLLTWAPLVSQANSLNIVIVAVTDDGTPALGQTNQFAILVKDYLPTAGTKLWEFQAGSAVNCAPAIGDDGTVYIGTVSGQVYAIDGQTGWEKWGFLTDGGASTPVVGGNGMLYVGSTNGSLYGLTLADGQKAWSFAAGAAVTTPAVDEMGTVYCGAGTMLYALNGQTGEKLWANDLGYPVISAPALGTNGAVYMGAAGYLYAVDRAAGTNRWVSSDAYAALQAAADNMHRPEGPLVVDHPSRSVITCPAIGQDGNLYAFLWSRACVTGYTLPLLTQIALVGVDPQTGHAWLAQSVASAGMDGSVGLAAAPVIGQGGKLFAGFSTSLAPISFNGQFQAMDLLTGTNIWTINAGQGNWNRFEGFTYGIRTGTAVGADGTVYFASSPQNSGLLNAVEGASGRLLWTFQLGSGWALSSPAISLDGTVYIGSAAGKLYAVAGTPNSGLAATSWPKTYGNARNTGSILPYQTPPALRLIVPAMRTVEVLANMTVLLSAIETDGSVKTFNYGLISAPEGVALDANTGLLTWTPALSQGGSTNRIVVVVSDNSTPALSATNSFYVIVKSPNQAPRLTVPETQQINELSQIVVSLSATDPDGPTDALRYLLVSGPAGVSVNATNGVVEWTPTEAQGPSTNTITVAVVDNGVPPLGATNSFTVIVNEVKRAPALIAPGTQTVTELQTLRLQLQATDSDIPTNKVTFKLVSAPEGMTVDAAMGWLTWTPTEAQGPSTNTVSVMVMDDTDMGSVSSFTVIVEESKSAPVVPTPADQVAQVGVAWSLQMEASDTDIPANTLAYKLVTGPVGMVIDAQTGWLIWTPDASQVGSTNGVAVQVADDTGIAAIASFRVTVMAANTPPNLFLPAPEYMVWVGAALSFTNTATDADVPANSLTFSLGTNAPAGAKIDANTGVFTWTAPATEATNYFTIVVTDDGTPAMSASGQIAVITRAVPEIRLQSISRDSQGRVQLSWSAAAGLRYQVQARAQVESGEWSDLSGTISATGSTAGYSETNSNQSQRFYRVKHVD